MPGTDRAKVEFLSLWEGALGPPPKFCMGKDGKAETEVTYNKNEETVYYVTATKAPEGYVLPAEEKKIVINENDINSDGTVQLNFEFEYSK